MRNIGNNSSNPINRISDNIPQNEQMNEEMRRIYEVEDTLLDDKLTEVETRWQSTQ